MCSAISTANDVRSGGQKVGIGLRDSHYDAVFDQLDRIDFVEVHAENFYVEGGPARALLHALREQVDISVHATSLGLGGECPPPRAELQRLRKLVDEVQPMLVSEHACFTWGELDRGVFHSGDLLPIAYDERTLARFARHVDTVQQYLGHQLLIENISAYLHWPESRMREFEFLQRLCLRTGAELLVDINNIYVNAVNAGEDTPLPMIRRILAEIDPCWIGELHLAGASQPRAGELMVDDHGDEVSEVVWAAYAHVLPSLDSVPTLIEWDTQLPPLERLLAQVDRARAMTAVAP